MIKDDAFGKKTRLIVEGPRVSVRGVYSSPRRAVYRVEISAFSSQDP